MGFLSSGKKRLAENERRKREEQRRADEPSTLTTPIIVSDSSGPAHVPLDSCHSTDSGGDGGICGGGE